MELAFQVSVGLVPRRALCPSEYCLISALREQEAIHNLLEVHMSHSIYCCTSKLPGRGGCESTSKRNRSVSRVQPSTIEFDVSNSSSMNFSIPKPSSTSNLRKLKRDAERLIAAERGVWPHKLDLPLTLPKCQRFMQKGSTSGTKCKFRPPRVIKYRSESRIPYTDISETI